MANLEKVKIVVVGDSGVGKTSLVHLICYHESLQNPAWTIGCSVEAKVHDYQQGTSQEKEFFVELWDVGGSANHKCSRSIFYNSMNGLILVHDLTNRKSYLNLRKWLAEVLSAGRENSGIPGRRVFKANVVADFENEEEYDPEQFAGNQVPILIVGTKMDQRSTMRTSNSIHGVNLAEEVGADSISLVIERRFYSRENSQTMFFQDAGRYDGWKERTNKRKVF